MATYMLDRLRVLVVDDNAFTRNTLADILATIGVGEILKAQDGLQAVKVMKNGLGGAPVHIDVVISDVVMPSVDGIKLVQWIRQSKDSPNRFMPFIMMSGAADDASVGRARDHGANEFLAKPFSPRSVADRLLALIDRPRQFVATREYFGPDRKRRTDDGIDEERRSVDESDVNIIYSADRVVRPKNPEEVYFFRLPNALRDKVGGSHGARGEIPVELLDEAEEMLGRQAFEYRAWVIEYVRTIARTCKDAKALPAGNRTAMFDKVNELAHELRGQGGIFGYPLISSVGEMLFALTQPPRDMSDNALQLVQAHLDIMHRVFADRIEGDGGTVGVALLAELRSKVADATRAKAHGRAATATPCA
ncbi:MAG: response regulator [Rhodospirillales bacterium]